MIFMASSKRFKKLCDRFSWKIKPLVCIINGKLTRRPDILAVESKNGWEMTIPKKMYAEPFEDYTNLTGQRHPDYFECESKLYFRKHGK